MQAVGWANYSLYGDRYPVTRNEPNGMTFFFFDSKAKQSEANLEIADSTGKL